MSMACHFWTVDLSLSRIEGIVGSNSNAGTRRWEAGGRRSPGPDGDWYGTSRCGASGGVGVADAGTTAASPVPS